jgi:effector-binding domain-containing protein
MIDESTIIDVPEYATAVVRVSTPRSEMREAMGAARRALHAGLAEQGISPAGPMFSHHFKMEPGIFDFEIGVPVDAVVTALGRLEPSRIPAAKMVSTIYHGGYEGLGEAWELFDDALDAQGLHIHEDLWETYLVGFDQSDDQSGFQTELKRSLL